MKLIRFSLILFTWLLGAYSYSQQVLIDDNYTPQQLIENNLVQGCVQTSNITSAVNGSQAGISSFGYFERGTSNFPFEFGIVLTTGSATSGGNGLNTAILNEGTSAWSSDPDLENALGISNTLNATSIEFDFISTSNQVQFNYLLASEEYFGDFPCNYSDGFAFLIKEAGTNQPYTNIALIPGTSVPVNTNTIHPEIVGFCPASYPQYFDGFNFPDTNYNGRTKTLSATAQITPNITYHIKMVIADQTDKNYDSAVFIQGNSFNASIDLGEDITTCSETLTLDGDTENPQAGYTWYFNGSVINGATQPTLDINQSGTYTVTAELPIAGSSCMIEDTIDVVLNSSQTGSTMDDFELCDDPSLDGVEMFDLSTRTDDILASLPDSNYAVSYHYSLENAQNNVNPIITPIANSSNNQTIYVRIEDLDEGCKVYSSFNLVVHPLPVITSPTILVACDDMTPDGIAEIDLTEKNDEITNGQPDLLVSYHITQADANSGQNAIPQPYVSSSSTEQVFVRVINSLTGCVSTTTLNIQVVGSPVINYEDLYIDACDQDHDGMATFDLTSILNEVIQGLNDVSVTFHETLDDAETGANPIVDPSNYANVALEEQTLYIRVEDDTTGCASIRSFEIHTNLLLTGTNIRDFSACDADNNGFEEFNLAALAADIIQNLEDITIDFYVSEEDQNNQVNALNQDVPFVLSDDSTTLYLTLNSPTCSEVAEIELILNEVTNFPSIGTVDYCDVDQDGFTLIDLHSFDSSVTNGTSGFTVTYFASAEDAANNENPLPYLYTNASNPQTFYPSLNAEDSECGQANSFVINVLPAPETMPIDDILICDDDQDGQSLVDLTQLFDQLVSDTTNRVFSFYDTNEELIQDVNAYTNISNFNTGTRGVHAKVTNTLTGCWSSQFFYIYVNTLPSFTDISDYRICELSTDSIGDFLFSTKDSEILNGQQGKQVSYYLNQQDADNGINEINKNVAYQNVSNPQTIFVRVDNLTDENCYGTSSFTIEVGTSPLYNEPENWFKCDDLSNDAVESFNFETKVDEITNGMDDNLNVTFYTSQEDAESQTNPLPLQFTNTVNPQQIYVRIDNGTICASFTSFTLNVIQVAQANPAQPLVMCDTDYDGIVTFDLTLAELEILDVRNDNIVIDYYVSMNDLEAESNPIANPESYTNISNPQTVFIRLTNTISNCYLALPLDLIVNLPPATNNLTSITACDNEENFYDLSLINSQLVEDTTNVEITYHSTSSDANNALNPLNTDYTYTSNTSTLYARIWNTDTGCFIIKSFQLVINPLPNVNTADDLIACDDDFDGMLEFDLTQQNASILGGQNPANYEVNFYNSLANAESGTGPLPYQYIATDGETIYVRVQNIATGCYNTTDFSVIILPKPFVDIPDQVICLDNLPLLVSANTNNPTDSYLWSTNATTAEIEISTIGSYWVTVTNEFGCETTQVFEVTESETATIDIVETIDFSDPNNITITVSGIGNYLYQLDDNPPQESNVFENAPLGYHTITIIDQNGCLEVTKEILVLDFPQFVTPNEDGFFDTWHIIGVETLPETVIYIYDRFGKQIHYLTAFSRGWDGTYNGYNLPATDYWFVAHVKGGGYDFEAKGHFALKR